jgi:3',5'-cyclic AMP phosphodiesterase CpdA
MPGLTGIHRQTFVSIFGEDRWRFEAAGWCFIGLNSLVMNSGLACEAEQFDWLASQLSTVNGKPVALFLHKPLFLNRPRRSRTGGVRDPLRSAAGAQPAPANA